jgi:hypothetical protein
MRTQVAPWSAASIAGSENAGLGGAVLFVAFSSDGEGMATVDRRPSPGALACVWLWGRTHGWPAPGLMLQPYGCNTIEPQSVSQHAPLRCRTRLVCLGLSWLCDVTLLAPDDEASSSARAEAVPCHEKVPRSSVLWGVVQWMQAAQLPCFMTGMRMLCMAAKQGPQCRILHAREGPDFLVCVFSILQV